MRFSRLAGIGAILVFFSWAKDIQTGKLTAKVMFLVGVWDALLLVSWVKVKNFRIALFGASVVAGIR